MKFSWHGINAQGEMVSGTLSARNKANALALLANDRIGVSKLTPIFQWRSDKRIKPKHIQALIEQLAQLLKANITLEQALQIAKQNSLTAMRGLITSIEHSLQQGASFSQALAEHPKSFKVIDCQIVAAGEQAGALDQLLLQLSQFKQRLSAVKSKIRKALFYPCSILICSIGIGFGMLRFVVPQFESMFASFNNTLPLYTRTIIAASDWLIAHQLSLLGVLILLIAGLLLSYKKSPRFKKALYRLLYCLPLIKIYLMQAQVIRFCQVLSTVLHAGLASFPALQLACRSISNPLHQRLLTQLQQHVEQGSALSDALAAIAIFPLQVTSFLQVGEASGQVAEQAQRLADYYQHQLDQSLDQLSKLLEPIIMLIVATLVGGLIIALYLPIFQMGAAV